jgi:hypothetical protein
MRNWLLKHNPLMLVMLGKEGEIFRLCGLLGKTFKVLPLCGKSHSDCRIISNSKQVQVFEDLKSCCSLQVLVPFTTDMITSRHLNMVTANRKFAYQSMFVVLVEDKQPCPFICHFLVLWQLTSFHVPADISQ